MPDDPILCAALETSSSHEALAAGTAATTATPLPGPDVLVDLTVPDGGGYVSLTLKDVHTTFVVYASGVTTLKLLLNGTALAEVSNEATCVDTKFSRIEHHSHMPFTYVVALPPTATGKSLILYKLL